MNECITTSEKNSSNPDGGTWKNKLRASFSRLVVDRMFLLKHSRNISIRTVCEKPVLLKSVKAKLMPHEQTLTFLA